MMLLIQSSASARTANGVSSKLAYTNDTGVMRSRMTSGMKSMPSANKARTRGSIKGRIVETYLRRDSHISTIFVLTCGRRGIQPLRRKLRKVKLSDKSTIVTTGCA